MAFDFINQAIDKVVGAGKAVKDVAVKADASYQDFMNTKVAPKAAKVGEVAVDTANLIIKPTKALIEGAAKDIGAKASYNAGYITEEEKNKRYQEASDNMVEGLDGAISKWASSLNQNILHPTAQTIKDASGGASLLGSVLDTTGDIIQSTGKNVGVGKIRDYAGSGTDKITNAAYSDETIGTRLLEGATGLTEIGLSGLMAIPVANVISGVVKGANDESGVTKKLEGAEKTIVQSLVDTGLSEKNAQNAFSSVMNAASLIFGAKGAKSATKMGKSGATEAKINSVLPTKTGTIKDVLSNKKLSVQERIQLLPQALKETQNARTLGQDVINANKPTITDAVSKTLTKGDIAKNALVQGGITAGYATAPDTIQLGVASVLGDNQNNQDEGNKISAGDALTYSAGAVLGAKPSGGKGGKKSKAPAIEYEVPTINVTGKMAFAKPSVPGENKATYTTSDPNITQIIRSSIVSSKGTAPTVTEHTNALMEAGFSPEDITAIRDFAVDNHTRGVIDAQKAKDFIIGLRNKQSTPTPTPTKPKAKAKVVPTTEKVITPEPTHSQLTPDNIKDYITSFKLGAFANKVNPTFGKYKIDFGNDFNKALYIIRENGKTRSASDGKFLQAVMDATGLDEASARRLGDVVYQDIYNKIYKTGEVEGNVVKVGPDIFSSSKTKPTKVAPTTKKAIPTPEVKAAPEPTPTPEAKAAPEPEPTPEAKAAPEPEPTPDVNQTLISLVETYKGDGKTKGKVGSIQVDFENELNKALYSVRESKNKLKPKDESTLQELARLSGLDEAQIRKLGEDVATKIKDKIYREKAVTPEGVKLDSAKDDTNVPKEDDILGLNDTPAPEVVSPLTQRYQELIANNAKEGDELSRAKGIFDFTPTGKIGNFFQKTFDKLWSNIDRIASTKTFLNNFRVGGGKELAGNYVESKQARDYSQLNSANIDEFNIADRVKESAIIPKRQLKEEDLVGATTPEGLVLDDKFAKEAYDTYRLDVDKVVERANPLIAKGVSSKDIKQSIESTYIYDVFKNNPEKLNEFFTPEQINILQKQYADNAAIQSEMAKSGQDIGVIPDSIDPESGYLRKVTTARAAERAGKMKGTDDGKIEVTLSDGTVMKVDTMEEALRLSALKRDSKDFDPENMSSLTKKQAGPEYDPFRVHGSTASLLSLNDAMSKLYADKNAIKFIDGLIEKGDPNYTGAMKTKAYNLMAKDVLGIRGTVNSEGSAEGHLGTAANIGTKGSMLVNVGNATTNIVPSYLRTLMRSSMDLVATAAARGIKEGWEGVKGAFKDAKLSQITKSIGDERVDARLRGLGLVNEYNIDNGSPYGKLEGQLMYMSNGTWAEIPGSKLAATLSMANSLNRAGRLEGAKDANDVIDRWEAWQKEGGQDFYEARGALDDQLRSLGKTGSTDKVNIPYVPASVNDILGKLKTWAVVQAMAQKEGINTVARSAIEKVFQKDRSYSNRQVEESIKDLGARYATYLATSAALGTIMQATGIFDENDDPEYKKLIIDEATRKIAPDPTVPYLWTLEQAVTSDSAATSTILNGGKAAFQLLAAIKNQIEGDKKESDVYLRDALANLGKIGTVRNVSDIVGTFNKGDSLQDIFAKGADTFSKEEATRTGVASGKNWNSSLDRGLKLFGINGEQARLDALHRMKNNLDAPDWVKSVPFGGLMYQAIQREVKPAIDFFDDTKSSGGGGDLMENGVKAGYAYDVVKELHNAKNTTEFFNNLGIQEGQGLAKDLIDKLFKSNVDANIKVDPRLTDLVARVSPDNFPESMDKVREVDPYLYNNIVATLGEMKRVKDQNGSLSPEVINKVVQDKLSGANKSISQEDYAIAQANNDHAITTSFTNTLGQEIEKVQADLGNSKPEEARKKMDNLERLATVMNSPSLFTYKIPFGNLVANNVTNIQKAFSVLGGDPNSYPVLKDLLLFGAKVVRGATDAGQAKPPAPTSVTPTPLSGTTLSSMVRKPVIIDKPATVSNITIDKPLKVGQLKIDPLLVKLPTSQQGASLSNQTLSSMVKRKTPKL